LNCKNQFIKEKVFLWLKTSLINLDNLRKTQDIEFFKDLILKNLEKLILINVEYSREIISRFLQSKEKEIIK
jgi:hypothetical protein